MLKAQLNTVTAERDNISLSMRCSDARHAEDLAAAQIAVTQLAAAIAAALAAPADVTSLAPAAADATALALAAPAAPIMTRSRTETIGARIAKRARINSTV
jgi:hypothetical protein